ncbi:SDR family NAD(P)-dependent oxidoreductase [Klebsiella pneumoniae]|uniref:SDR family NAD(P)-dependent oxidoreductase n=1 Tax=Klebsiella pneumoniae TaxID=573 RepID=UPI002119BB31|nr:SDR family NAD(P)-dependent oxidoreductase [Klebsiella pneumoniae]
MKNRFTDKKILIIGGSSGIGEATARAFAEAGGHVTIASRNMSKLQAAATRIGSDRLC